MKLQGYTPGPWRWYTARTMRHLHDANGSCFAGISMPKRNGYHEEDAALIAQAPALLEQRDKAMRALEHLTPSGSEFVGDVDACVKWIRDAREQEHKMLVKFKGQRDKLVKALRAMHKAFRADSPVRDRGDALEQAERVLVEVEHE